MKVTKQQRSLAQETLCIAAVPVGQPVWYPAGKRLIMKVKPTGFLLNSNIVADVSQRGDCFVCALATGTIYAMQGSVEVQATTSELIWSEL